MTIQFNSTLSRNLDSILLTPNNPIEKKRLLELVDQCKALVLIHQADCCICLETGTRSIQLHPQMSIAESIHSICIQCIKNYSITIKKLNNTCPTCRAPLKSSTIKTPSLIWIVDENSTQQYTRSPGEDSTEEEISSNSIRLEQRTEQIRRQRRDSTGGESFSSYLEVAMHGFV